MTKPEGTTGGLGEIIRSSSRLLSICIPTYNRARYLREAIESLLPQLGSDTELLVYDTGSDDRTQDFMEDIKSRSPEVRYIRREQRLGVDETLLLLLAESCGEYVWFFGSDDVLKTGAVAHVRERILRYRTRPTMIYLNHEIVDLQGRLLVASQVGTERDRVYPQGWKAVPWLGMNLGYISACVLQRAKALSVTDAKEWVGSRWVSWHLYLSSLLSGGSLEYIGQPLLEARRNPSACSEYAEVFVCQTNRVLDQARRSGYPWLTIWRAKDRIVRSQFLRLVVAWRCDDFQELTRTFPQMVRSFWMCPSLWLVVTPLRLAPARLARAIRDRLRRWRERRNERLASRWVPVRESAARQS